MVLASRSETPPGPNVTSETHQSVATAGKPRRNGLTTRQIAAVQYVIHLFMEEDLERGVSPTAPIYCAGCAQQRPRAGALPYGGHLLCNICAAQFEVARACRRTTSVGQFIRDKQFGEAERYALPPIIVPSPRHKGGDHGTSPP